jgi:Flp pilus assembly protein TadG
MARISKSKSRKGAEMIEFTLALLPLLMMIFVLMDASWGMFAKSTLAYAVRSGLRVCRPTRSGC